MRSGIRRRGALATLVVVLALAPALVAEAAVNDTTLVSRADGPAGVAADGDTRAGIAVSADGRYVAFVSEADNLSDADDNAVANLFVRDRVSGTTTLVSRATGLDGAPADAGSANPSISADGNLVAFESAATNLSFQDADPRRDVFVRDVAAGTTTLVSRAGGAFGAGGTKDSVRPSLAASGTAVAFESTADNLSVEDGDGTRDIFVRDLATGGVTLVSRASGSAGAAGDSHSYTPSISADGRRVAFASDADNLSDEDDDSVTNVYVRSIQFRLTTFASRADSFTGAPGNGDSFAPALSAEGRYVAFRTFAGNLSGTASGPASTTQLIVRDIQANVTTLVSRASGASGTVTDADAFRPSVSEGARYVAFKSPAEGLAADDTATFDIFVRDTFENTTTLVSRASGASGAAASGNSFSPALSANGRVLAFVSEADNLAADDNDAVANVYVRELPEGIPLPPPPPPDLGDGDHGEHEPGDGDGDHGGGDHGAGGGDHAAGGGDHAAGGHAAGGTGHAGGHAGGGSSHDAHPAGEGPGYDVVISRRQSLSRLQLIVSVHQSSTLLVVKGDVKVSGRKRPYPLKRVRKRPRIHAFNTIRLKLSRKSTRAVKRALKRGRRARAKVTITASDRAGNRSSRNRTITIRR